MSHHIAHLLPVTSVPTKYQLPTPYICRDTVRTRFYRSRSLRQGQRSNQGHTVMLHTCTPNQFPYQASTSYTLCFPRYSLDNSLYVKLTTARSNQGHTILHTILPVTSVHTKYQLPTPYSCRDTVRTRFYRSKSLWQGQRSNQGHTMTLHTYTPNQCPYQVSISYTLQLLRYSPDKIL